MRWTIAILTMACRRGEFERLSGALQDQIIAAGIKDIELLVANQEHMTISQKRQWCLDRAKGQYFNFIDDDDMVAHNYISRIYPLLDGKVDYIGFRLQMYIDGKPAKPTYHSLKNDGWYEDSSGYYRDVSHLNPMRTRLARLGRFDGGYGEDHKWGLQVHPQTEYYIPETMYFYYYSPKKSLARQRYKEEQEEKARRPNWRERERDQRSAATANAQISAKLATKPR